MTNTIKDFLILTIRIVQFVAVMGLFFYLIKTDIIRWQMLAIFGLLIILITTEIFSVAMTMSFVNHDRDLGVRGVIILVVGAIGYLYAPIGIYAIYRLTKSLDIMWPLHLTIALYALIFVGGIYKFQK